MSGATSLPPFRCAACDGQFPLNSKAGEVRISIYIKAGGNMATAQPICLRCAENAATGPEAALSLMRKAAPRVVAEG